MHPNSRPHRATRRGSASGARPRGSSAASRRKTTGRRRSAATRDRTTVCRPGVSRHAAAARGSKMTGTALPYSTATTTRRAADPRSPTRFSSRSAASCSARVRGSSGRRRGGGMNGARRRAGEMVEVGAETRPDAVCSPRRPARGTTRDGLPGRPRRVAGTSRAEGTPDSSRALATERGATRVVATVPAGIVSVDRAKTTLSAAVAKSPNAENDASGRYYRDARIPTNDPPKPRSIRVDLALRVRPGGARLGLRPIRVPSSPPTNVLGSRARPKLRSPQLDPRFVIPPRGCRGRRCERARARGGSMKFGGRVD